jgi:hypothetical protein
MIKYEKLLVYSNLLKTSIKCSLCLNTLNDPVVANCSHLFCFSCIQKSNRTDNDIKCPTCQQAIISDHIGKINIHKKLVVLAQNVLNSIDKNKNLLINQSKRKRKKAVTNIIQIQDKHSNEIKTKTNQVQENINTDLKHKPIFFYLKGALKKPSPNVVHCTSKRDFGVQVDMVIDFQKKREENNEYMHRAIILETPTKSTFDDELCDKSIIKSATRMESVSNLSVLRGYRRSLNNITFDHYDTLNETIISPGPDLKGCIFSTSLLNTISKDKVNEFARLYDIVVSDDVSVDTTHLIVQTDGGLVCGVTTKYLKAISRKLWILSVDWIFKSIESKRVLDFIEYEIQGDNIFGTHFGPTRSRESKSLLFDGFEFLCTGRFSNDSISIEDFFELVKLSGANMVNKAKDFKENTKRIVLFDDNQKINETAANFMLKTAKIQCIKLSWFFDSLACNSIRDTKNYSII